MDRQREVPFVFDTVHGPIGNRLLGIDEVAGRHRGASLAREREREERTRQDRHDPSHRAHLALQEGLPPRSLTIATLRTHSQSLPPHLRHGVYPRRSASAFVVLNLL